VGRGTKPDGKLACDWYRKAAVQNHYKAQLALGKNYLDGNGIKKDVKMAESWIRKSAEQGHHKAEYEMGMLYRDGIAVKKDAKEAYMWFELAAKQDHVFAQQARDALAKTMKAEEIAAAKLAASNWHAKLPADAKPQTH
jgi:TPR repeat protein